MLCRRVSRVQDNAQPTAVESAHEAEAVAVVQRERGAAHARRIPARRRWPLLRHRPRQHRVTWLLRLPTTSLMRSTYNISMLSCIEFCKRFLLSNFSYASSEQIFELWESFGIQQGPDILRVSTTSHNCQLESVFSCSYIQTITYRAAVLFSFSSSTRAPS